VPGLQIRNISIFQPHSDCLVLWVIQAYGGINFNDNLQNFSVGHEQEGSQDSYRVMSYQFRHGDGVPAGEDDQADQHPHVHWKGKLKASLCKCIHSVVKTRLKAQVKVQPGYEYSQDVHCVSRKEELSVHLHNVCVEYQAVFHSSGDCQPQDGQKGNEQFQ